MRATGFEFRHRFFVICLIFAAGFSAYRLDHTGIAAHIANLLPLPKLIALRTVFTIGALFVIAGAALRTWATAYLQTSVVHDVQLHSDHLVADGPYRYLRNPLYLGLTLLGIGIGLLASSVGFAVIVAGLILFQLRLIFREETELRKTQGSSFVNFTNAVPRLIPSLTPRLPASGKKPNWPQAFRGEAFMWAFSAAMIAFVITLDAALSFAISMAALVIYGAGQALQLKKRRASQATQEDAS